MKGGGDGGMRKRDEVEFRVRTYEEGVWNEVCESRKGPEQWVVLLKNKVDSLIRELTGVECLI